MSKPQNETPDTRENFATGPIEASAMAAYERHSKLVSIMKIALPLGAATGYLA